MRTFLLLIFIHSACLNSFAQPSTITFNFSQPQNSIVIYSFYGNTSIPVDSLVSNKNIVHLTKKAHSKEGFYRFKINNDKPFDLICVANDSIVVNYFTQKDTVYIDCINSHENTLLWQAKQLFKSKPLDTAYKKVFELIDKNKATFFAKTTLPVLLLQKQELTSDFFFNYIDFSDCRIVQSTLLPTFYIYYLQNYTQHNEDGFKKSIDLILEKSMINTEVQNYTFYFLLNLFNEIGPEIILEYIVSKVDDGCIEQKFLSNYQNLIDSYLLVKEGQIIENIPFPDLDTDLHTLSKNSNNTLILFWHSECKFCIDFINNIKALYPEWKKKGLQVIALSIDNDIEVWERFVIENKLNWLNIYLEGGWDNEIMRKLKINRTPFYYLIDNRGVILKRSYSILELNNLISDF
ncbi:MAG: peroxiredoxin family protein [Flavobacteriales bacterium]